ncbi:MAG: LysM peptidoglycan-binding domain-containing protein [Chloroflexi bacterium]|nr:LysM peptidoglycan-binding domain-containing protein [Chloroflexota bacterium]
MRLWLLIGCVLGALLACNITTTAPNSAPQAPASSNETPPSVQEGGLDTQPLVTPEIAPGGACVPQSNLPTYTVEPGDSLSLIADQFSTTVDTLIAINCLEDPDLIEVGQVLYVPGALNGALPDSVTMIGSVVITPLVRIDNNVYVLRANTSVMLSWNPNVGGAVRINFYFASTGTGIIPGLIGSDTNAADGGTLLYNVPGGLLGYFTADAVDTNGQIVALTAEAVMVMAE